MRLYQVETSEHEQHVRELFWEYLQWANQKLNEDFDVNFDIAVMLQDDMRTLDKFLPPNGRLFLGEIDGQIAGLACMKKLDDRICEIKRMYVRPAFQGQHLGRALLQRLINEARLMGFSIMRLDSARFMSAAHALYRSTGFQEIEPYQGSEIPEEFQQHWIFLELRLT
jgi:GNAT superfamily N-acetyltransferase